MTETERAIAIIEARLPLYTDIGQINALRECISSIRSAALSAGQAQPVAIKPNHVNGGAYRKISVEEWRALGGDNNKFCDWHEGIGYVVYDDQALQQYLAKTALRTAPEGSADA